MTDQALSPRVATTVRRPLSALSSPREVVRQFTPNWFTASMGTGILAVGLSLFPVALPGLRTVAEALWLFNIALFGLFCALYAARWIAYPKEAARIFGHSVVSMFFGAIPMALATIINASPKVATSSAKAWAGRRAA